MSKAPPSTSSSPGTADGPAGSLGTFAGVFTPSVLTILGIILFLRLGYVVGAAGVPKALVMVLMANAISIVTSLSLSAIATNLRVKGGGDYYLISRTLGVEYGGAIGLVLFLAQAVSIAFYAIGFGEAVAGMVGSGNPLLPQIIAAVAVSLLFVLAWVGADLATKFQFVVMAVLISALVAFVVGSSRMASVAQLEANLAPASSESFWVLFAIFFPAVTGFTQGVSMSGDLKDPGRSLPRGTFAAVFLSFGVYVVVALLFGAAMSGSELAADYTAMRKLSLAPGLIDAGVIAATLSSAMASFLGAPRILQSLAADKVFPILNPFAVGSGPTNNPRRGVLLAGGIAAATVAAGNLNAIATIVSMFFLISYGLLNYATFFEAQANSPSFRPRFRFFSAWLSLAGAGGCLAIMLAISPTAAAIASVALFTLYQYLSRSNRVERWADSSRSHRLQRVRNDLHAVRVEVEHDRDWRPVLAAFSDDPSRRARLLYFASWLEGRSGFSTLVRLEEGQGAVARRDRVELERQIKADIRERGLDAFARVILAEEVESAVPVLLQAYGVGEIRTNTVLLNWYDREDEEGRPGLPAYSAYVRTALRYDCNVLLLAARQKDFDAIGKIPRKKRRIDVWWCDDASGRLMLLLAYLMTRSEPFARARIRLYGATSPEDTEVDSETALRAMLEDVRIDADVEIVDRPSVEVVRERSSDAAVVFQSFRLRGTEATSSFDGSIEDAVKGLGCTVLVQAREEIVLDSEPDTGLQAEIASAIDRARSTREARDTGRTRGRRRSLERRRRRAQGGGSRPRQHDCGDCRRARAGFGAGVGASRTGAPSRRSRSCQGDGGSDRGRAVGAVNAESPRRCPETPGLIVNDEAFGVVSG